MIILLSPMMESETKSLSIRILCRTTLPYNDGFDCHNYV